MTTVMFRLVRGAAALGALLALVVGLPALLTHISADLIPSRVSATEVWIALLSPDNGRVLVGALLLVAWVTWATLMVSFAVEVPAQLRRVHAPRLPGLALQQRLIGTLVAAVIGLVAVPAAVATPSAEAADGPRSSAQLSASATPTPVPQHDTTTRNRLHRHVEPGSQDRADDRVHTVRRGDSLSLIATRRLGSADAWPELLAANRRLIRDPDLIRPGWVLTLPSTDPATRPEQVDRERSHLVRRGETLWSIAADELGDAERWPVLVRANPRLAVDPDVLRVGSVISIPTRTEQDPRSPTARRAPLSVPERATPHAPLPAPARATPDAPHSAPTREAQTGTSFEGPTVAERGAEPSIDARATGSSAEDAGAAGRVPWGSGTVLATGIVGLLAALRSTQRRRRRAGERLHLPDLTSLRETETTMQSVADSELVSRLDRVLRELAARCREGGRSLPSLRAARLTGSQIELYLADADQLPSPWLDLSSGSVWATRFTDLSADSDDGVLGSDLRAPYPALVTVGHDQDDALLLLDLEEIGSLAVSGDPETVRALLTAFSIELATSRWVDDSQVTLVGVLPELATAVRTGRLRHVDHLELLIAELEQRVRDVLAVLAVDGATDLRHARGLAVADDTWTPEIVVLGDGVPPHLRERMAAVVARSRQVGIVAITGAGEPLGEWVLGAAAAGDTGGRLSPADIAVRSQGVSASELEMIISLLGEAARPPQAGPDWSAPSHASEPSIAELPSPGDAPDVSEGQGPGEDQGRPAPVHLLRAAPRLTVLGTVALQHALGPEPISFGSDNAAAASQLAKATELVGYLALHREGATLTTIAEALYPGRELRLDRTAKLLSRTRRWLGARTDGGLWIPRVEGDGPIRLDPGLQTDWDDVRDLVGDSLRTAPDDRLRAALGLVSERPFTGIRPGSWAWVEPYREEVTAALVDLVHEVADRAIRAGAADVARDALALGRRIDPDSELLWRDALRAEYVAGDPAEQARLTRQLLARSDVLEIDLDPATSSLLADLERASGQ